MPKRASAERCVRVLGTTMAMNPSREPHIVQVRGYFRIDVYERPVQLTLGALGLEAQRELLAKPEPVIQERRHSFHFAVAFDNGCNQVLTTQHRVSHQICRLPPFLVALQSTGHLTAVAGPQSQVGPKAREFLRPHEKQNSDRPANRRCVRSPRSPHRAIRHPCYAMRE